MVSDPLLKSVILETETIITVFDKVSEKLLKLVIYYQVCHSAELTRVKFTSAHLVVSLLSLARVVRLTGKSPKHNKLKF